MNAVLLVAYIADYKRIVERWNRELEKLSISERIALPDHKFHRYQGVNDKPTDFEYAKFH